MSSDVQWMIIRNNSSFLQKRKNQGGLTFSTEAGNLKSRNTKRYNGLVNAATVSVEPAEDGKGVVLVTKNPKNLNKPATMYRRVELKGGARKTLNTIRNVIRNTNCRKDLKMAAVRRASAILNSQKPVVVRNVRAAKKKD